MPSGEKSPCESEDPIRFLKLNGQDPLIGVSHTFHCIEMTNFIKCHGVSASLREYLEALWLTVFVFCCCVTDYCKLSGLEQPLFLSSLLCRPALQAPLGWVPCSQGDGWDCRLPEAPGPLPDSHSHWQISFPCGSLMRTLFSCWLMGGCCQVPSLGPFTEGQFSSSKPARESLTL